MRTTNYKTTKIDHRHNYIICMDTEATNCSESMDEALMYDLGGTITDTKGRIYERFSFVNADIYLREKELMQSAYYAHKLPQYEQGLRDGSRTMTTTLGMRKYINELCEAYGVKFACAHNARFDKNALDNTLRYATKSKYRYFLPYGIEWWDTMKMARSVMHKMPTYRKFCEANNYITKTGQLSTTAENLYRFVSKNNNFVESHTGFEDVEIEMKIMLYCFRQHKKMEKRLYRNNRPLVENTDFQIALNRNLKIFPTI